MNFEYTKKIAAVILAAGSGTRMGTAATKQLLSLCGETVLHRTVRAFDACGLVNRIVVVCKSDEIDFIKEHLCSGFSKPISFVVGGSTRFESAKIGFHEAGNVDFVAIHDAARCLITPAQIASVIEAALLHGAASAVALSTDTLKLVDSDDMIQKTVPRDRIYSAQTPQVFSREIYERALKASDDLKSEITDDNMLAEFVGAPVKAVVLGKENIKITTKADLDFAQFIIGKREYMTENRIGHGYDVHRFDESRPLILGGVEIPSEMGLLGHSDADVLTHAVMDALLGAAALGDIGRHFPDTSEEFRGISSLVLLGRVRDKLSELGYGIVNIDVTLVMQKPKIAPFIDSMVENLSEVLMIDKGRINVKATTEEHLGFTGRCEGAAAHAVALIKKIRGCFPTLRSLRENNPNQR